MAQKEFKVVLDGIKLSADAEKRIEKGIQSLVMQELAGYKPNPDGPVGGPIKVGPIPGRTFHIPIDWIGIVARDFNLKEAKQIFRF